MTAGDQAPVIKAAFVAGRTPADVAHLNSLAQRVELTVVVGDPMPGDGSHLDAAIEVLHFPPIAQNKLGGSLQWWLRGFGRWLKTSGVDVLHVISEPWGLMVLQAAIRNVAGPPVVVVHGCETQWWTGSAPERVAKSALTKLSLPRLAGFAGENEASISLARRHGLPDSAPTALIHTNPRDPAVFSPAPDGGRSALRESFSLPDGVGVGFAGRLVEEKGVLVLLDAFESLRSTASAECWLAIAGDGPLRAEIERRADGKHIFYLGPLAFPKQVADFYSGLDIFAFASWKTAHSEEQGPRALIEAMMSGLLIVASRSGAIEEMVSSDAVLVRERSSEDLERGLKDALHRVQDGEVRRRVRQHALTMYSPDVVARKMEDLWVRALEPRSFVEQ